MSYRTAANSVAAMAYEAVSPKELEERGGVTFPNKFGVTALGTVVPGSMDRHGEDGAVRLEFRCADFDPDAHMSIGVAEGHCIVDMAHKNATAWTGAPLLRNGIPHEVSGDPLGDGTYQVTVVIDAEAAAQIKLCEQEHLADFAYAWGLTYGNLRSAASTIAPAASTEAALDQLVALLHGRGDGYLVPAAPHDLGSWGKRGSEAFVALCWQSTKRDDRGEHSSRRYVLQAVAGTPRKLLVRPVLEPGKAGSASHIRPDEINVVHTVAGHHAADPRSGPDVGSTVTWGAEPRHLSDRDVYAHARDTQSDVADAPAVKRGIAHGLPVVARDGTWLWMRADLADPALKAIFADVAHRGWTEAYVRAETAHLRIVGT